MSKKETEKVTIERDFNKQFYLLKYDSNWAGEMDINGFIVYDKDEYNEWLSKIPKRSFEFGIGTNETIEYRNKAELLKEVKVTVLTAEEVTFFYKFFASNSVKCIDWDNKAKQFARIETKPIAQYGFFPDLDYFDVMLEDDEQD